MKKIKNSTKKKIKIIFIKTFFVILYICVIYSIIVLINTAITGKSYMSIFGISFFTMEDNTMTPSLHENDLIITKDIGKNKPTVNDIISYSINDYIKINRIVNIKNSDGQVKYITKGDNNYYENIEEITNNQIIGEVLIRVPILGFITNILEMKFISILCMIILVLRFSYNKYIYKKKTQRKRKKYVNNKEKLI